MPSETVTWPSTSPKLHKCDYCTHERWIHSSRVTPDQPSWGAGAVPRDQQTWTRDNHCCWNGEGGKCHCPFFGATPEDVQRVAEERFLDEALDALAAVPAQTRSDWR